MSGGIAKLTQRFARLRGAIEEANDDLGQFQQTAERTSIDDQTSTIAPRRRRPGFGAGAATATTYSPAAGADVAESMEEFFRSSSVGNAIEKIIGGYAVGDVTAEDLLDRILKTQERLTEAFSGRSRTDPSYLLDTFNRQLEFFRTAFSSLGDPGTLARELADFRRRFPTGATPGDTRTRSHGTGTSTSGTLGTPIDRCCGSGGAGMDFLRLSGALR